MAKAVPISARPHSFHVRPAPGWLEVVADEVNSILKNPLQRYKFEPKVSKLKSVIKVSHCDWRQGLELPLRLLTAHDVEWVLLDEKCSHLGEAEKKLSRMDWNEFLSKEINTVHVAASSPKLRDGWCELTQREHVSEGASFRIKIDYQQGNLKVLLSLAGAPLYQRGYKAELSAIAPLPEHQAAAMVKWTLAWAHSPIRKVFVPFAGSGTLGFETLLYLSGSGMGHSKRSFAFEMFPCTPSKTVEFIKRKLMERYKTNSLPLVEFCEVNAEQAESLRSNVKGFPLKTQFRILEEDFFDLKTQDEKNAEWVVLLNPPFGNRLAKKSSTTGLYSKIAKHLNRTLHLSNNVVGSCICPDEATWRVFVKELRVSHCETHHFTHGGKQMRLVRWRTAS